MEAPSIIRPHRDRLRRARIEAGLTQEELAAKTKISLAAIGKYERGQRSPRGPNLRRIADATSKPVPWFFGEPEDVAA